MTLTFLGTGTSQGVPVIACPCAVCASQDPRDKRLRSSALITTDDGKNLLIDIGPDFREQMLREKVDHLDGILVTHAHRDHVGGIDDIRSFNYVQHCNMHVYANHTTLQAIHHAYGYIFEPHEFAGLPEADLFEVDSNTPFFVDGVSVIAIAALHKYLPVLGFRIGNLAYLTDFNHITPSETEKLRGCHTLVLGCLRRQKHFSHLSLPEALDFIESVNPQVAYLTHISHEMGFHEATSSELPPRVHLAYDGLRISC